jgi:hypothetical protein
VNVEFSSLIRAEFLLGYSSGFVVLAITNRSKRTQQAVTLFAKKRKKVCQPTVPFSSALGVALGYENIAIVIIKNCSFAGLLFLLSILWWNVWMYHGCIMDLLVQFLFYINL